MHEKKSGSRWNEKWGVFQLYFLPIIITIIFMLFVHPEVDRSMEVYFKNTFRRWILKSVLFLLIVYIINLVVFNKWEEEFEKIEERCPEDNNDYELF